MVSLSFRIHVWKFLSTVVLLTTAAAEWWVCFGPPWLTHAAIASLTSVFSLTVYFIAFWLLITNRQTLSSRILLTAGGAVALLFAVYLWLFLTFTAPLPDHCHREVIGWDLTPAAQAVLSHEPGMTVEELLEDAGRQVEVVFTGSSLRAMRFFLTGMWLLSFGCLAVFLALFTAWAEISPNVERFPRPTSRVGTKGSIFLSYRRSDSQEVVGRIYDTLTGQFPRDTVFKDVDSIPLGVSFPEYLRKALSAAKVVLVVIGPDWLTASNANGQRRLDAPDDFVRLEVETALRLNIPIIPVAVSNATLPTVLELPELLRELALRNGLAVRPDPDFHRDMERLLSRLFQLLAG